jgi:hypothetical protein
VPVVLEVKDLNNRAHSTYFTLQKMVEGGETQEKVSSLVDFINDPETEFDCRLASFLSALDIIESMYERGFIHLDFHPGNFLVSLSLDGVNVYPIDFGLTFTIDDDCITRHQGDGAAAAPCQKFYDSFRAKLTGFKQNACDICCSWVKTTLSKLSIDNLKVEVERLIGVFSITREIADSILRFLANGEADSAILATSVYME